MSNNYWSNVNRARISRRRALAAASGFGALAAFTAACGGGDDGGANSDSSGLVSTPTDSLPQAKRGGVFKHFQAIDILHFDATASNSTGVVNQASIFSYPRLLKWETAKYPKEPDGTSTG